MKRSQTFIKTLKETPADADSINASLLVRASYIAKNMAGVYALLPLGHKVYQKVEKIIREGMNAVDGQEVLLNVLQPRELWRETGRWEEIKDIMYHIIGDEIGLAPTHEEQVTDIVRKKVFSYKDLPLSLYQIQAKFRNEPRAKSGLLRGREFMMKDMYSFHTSEEDFEKYYQRVIKAYQQIFAQMGLETKVVAASGGIFSKHSHEFQVLYPTGEDAVFVCSKCDWAENKDIATVHDGGKCPKCAGAVKEERSIEVGNIFPLKNKFSKAMKALFKDKAGKEQEIIMGCYGIGLSRVIGTVVEVHHDDYGIIWPKEIAPCQVNLISLGQNKAAEEVYQKLLAAKVEVLFDDREDISAGEKFADADLIGIPTRVVISDKSLKAGGAEISTRGKKEQTIVKISEILGKIEE